MHVEAGIHLGPYEIVAPLGAGGMGEVYRAHDPRLGREVAVKVLPEPVAKDPERLRRFEHEARAVGALNHPNILTIHDVGTHEGSPYVVTELLEGETLREVLMRRTPTTRQVLSWAAQTAHGLSAAHQKGIVHRDIKPENLFLTNDGRLKILDFGLAKLVSRTAAETQAATASGPSEAGVVLGTVAYMSPEQVAAEGVDHRSDIFSLGTVLYELLSREHPFRRATVPATLTAILHETPLDLSVRQPGLSPAVGRIVCVCLEKRRDDRFQSAHDLALALEAALEGGSAAAALSRVEERSPYPGLSSFTEEDAGRFFGREQEVEALWRKLHDRQLLAVIGPSGAGKTSFVRAGVVAARPEGWAAIVATPGNAPLRGLGRALGPQLASDPEALRELAGFEDGETAFELLSRWKRNHDEALLVVDQFEELFTLNPPETRAGFALLLGRLAKEADIHVLLSLRDDFLMRCLEHEALAPVIDSLTPLRPMTPEGLRRAIVEPAARRGYRFEDDALVDEMIGSVEGARAALPLLAFAVSRLWDRRDAEKKLLTREAYREIGGVEGALAQHAEETMERIGLDQEKTVREVFRNLTTAQGTRAALDREELVSALPDRAAAESVLTRLIDARLLTSWETETVEGQPARHRVEVVHESLLSAWPRLARWQTQDADGAQLRDQLRQAAHLWEGRGKTDDLLWTGSSYLDYRAWRGRYPGKLSSLEEDFAGSMAALSERKRHRRRTAFGSILVALIVGLGVMAVLWKRSEVQKIRAEASKLLALAQAEFETDPAAALAYVTKSIELDDTEPARHFALRLVQNAPIPSELAESDDPPPFPAFSPNGEWLAVTQAGKVRLFNQDGREPVTISPGEFPPGAFRTMTFGPDGKILSLGFRDELRLLSVPDGREVRNVKYAQVINSWCLPCGGIAWKKEGATRTFFRRSWDGGEQLIGTLADPVTYVFYSSFARDFSVMAYSFGRKLFVKALTQWDAPARLLGEHPAEVEGHCVSANGSRLAATDRSGEIRIWDTASTSGRPLRVLPAPNTKGRSGINSAWLSPGGRWVESDTGGEGHASVRAWDLTAPPGAAPLVLRSRASIFFGEAEDPLDRVIALRDGGGIGGLFLLPLPGSLHRVIEWREGLITSLAFTADGATLVAATTEGDLRAWPLSADAPESFHDLPKVGQVPRIAAAPTRREIVVESTDLGLRSARSPIQVIPVDGGEPRELQGFPRSRWASPVAFSPSGRRAAAAPHDGPATGKRVYVWELGTGAVQLLEPVPGADDKEKGGFIRLSFVGDDRVVATVNGNGLMSFDLRNGKGVVLSSLINGDLAVGRSGRVGVGLACGDEKSSCGILRFGFDGSAPVPLPYRAGVEGEGRLALDPTETLLASTGPENSVRIGPVSGGEPHLLFGHKGRVNALAFSPDGKWLASAGDDQILRLWPIPDVTKVPPHKRGHGEFLATLRTFTNVRAVPDVKSPNGWKLEPGPFPGWQTEPHW